MRWRTELGGEVLLVGNAALCLLYFFIHDSRLGPIFSLVSNLVRLIIDHPQPFQSQAIAKVIEHQLLELLRQDDARIPPSQRRLLEELSGQVPGAG